MIYLAFGAGVYGYLFPGNINTMMMSLYGHKKYLLLAGILSLALLFEFAYCATALTFYKAIGAHTIVAQVLSYAGCAMGIFFGCWILVGKKKPAHRQEQAHIVRGLISIVVHPQQITFWLYIYALIRPLAYIDSPAKFALFDVLGCTVIFCAYMLAGPKLMRALKVSDAYLQKIVGVLYLASSVTVLGQVVMGSGV